MCSDPPTDTRLAGGMNCYRSYLSSQSSSTFTISGSMPNKKAKWKERVWREGGKQEQGMGGLVCKALDLIGKTFAM